MQSQETTTVFISNDADSLFVQLLAGYLHLEKRFRVQLVRTNKSLVDSGREMVTQEWLRKD